MTSPKEKYSLERLSGPTGEPISLQEAKLHLRVDISDDDALISQLIAAAREYITTVTGLELATTSWLLCYPEFPGHRFEMPCPPLLSISRIRYKDLEDELQIVPPLEYEVIKGTAPGMPSSVQPVGDLCWPKTRCHRWNAVQIEFQSGFVQIPDTLKAAAKLLVGHWYEHREDVVERQIFKVPKAADSLLWANRINVQI